jgi:hypothetical protein
MTLMATRQNQNKQEVASIISDFDQSAQEHAQVNLAKLQAFLVSASLPHTYGPLVEFGVESISDFLNPLLVNESALRSGLGLTSFDVDRMLLVQAAAMKGQPMPPAPTPIECPDSKLQTQPTNALPVSTSKSRRGVTRPAPTVAPPSLPAKEPPSETQSAANPALSRRIMVSRGAEEAKDEINVGITAKEEALLKKTPTAVAPPLTATTGAFSIGDMVRLRAVCYFLSFEENRTLRHTILAWLQQVYKRRLLQYHSYPSSAKLFFRFLPHSHCIRCGFPTFSGLMERLR